MGGRPPFASYYAVGDIHGRADLLDMLLLRIEAHAAGTPGPRALVLLGDYVDRGRESRAVLERLRIGLDGFTTIALKGNHEEMFLDMLASPDEARWRLWAHNGGRATLASYGPLPETGPPDERWLRTHVPRHHLRFLEALELYHAAEGLLFVHAGILPGRPLAAQKARDLLWIRDAFLRDRRDHGFRVVHGHSPVDAPEILPNRINVDTLAYASGRLTCAVIDAADPGGDPVILEARGAGLPEGGAAP